MLYALRAAQAEHRALATRLLSPELRVPQEALVAELHTLLAAERKLRGELRSITTKPMHALPFLQPGRLARFIVESGRACVVVVNKWDLVPNKDDALYRNSQKYLEARLPVVRLYSMDYPFQQRR